MKKREILWSVGKAILKSKLSGASKEAAPSSTSAKKETLPTGIAREGEKLIAVKTGLNVDENIVRRGEILTVDRYHLGSYCFTERPAAYCPYAGEVARPWYPASAFLPADDVSSQIVRFLDSIESSLHLCGQQLLENIDAYQPAAQLKMFSSAEKRRALCDEYLALTKEFDLLFQASVEQPGQENLQLLLKTCQAAEDREPFSLNTEALLERFHSTFTYLFSNTPSDRMRSLFTAPQKRCLITNPEKDLAELRQHLKECISQSIRKNLHADDICNLYADYILRYMQRM